MHITIKDTVHTSAPPQTPRKAEMSTQTAQMIQGWLEQHEGNAEAVARWMRDTLRIGSIRACRALVAQAVQAVRS